MTIIKAGPVGTSEISFLQNSREDGFPSSADPARLESVAVVDRVLFPLRQSSPRKALCQLHVTPSGLFLMGYSTFDPGEAERRRTEAGLKTAVGGIAGAALAGSDLDAADNERKRALEEYARVKSSLDSESLASKFQRAPVDVHYIPLQHLRSFRFPEDWNGQGVIETVFGTVEPMQALAASDLQSLRDWWESVKEGVNKKGAEPQWTLSKAVLYYDTYQCLDLDGLANYVYATLEKSGDAVTIHRFLRGVFEFSSFWDFLSQLKRYGPAGAKDLIAKVTAQERKGVPKRVVTGILLALSGPFIVYFSDEMTARTSGCVALIFILTLLGGIVFTLWGIGRIIRALSDLSRSKFGSAAIQS